MARQPVGRPTKIIRFAATLERNNLPQYKLTVDCKTPHLGLFFYCCFGHGKSAGNKAGVRVTASLVSLDSLAYRAILDSDFHQGR